MTNRELVESAFAAFQRGDLDAAFAGSDPDFEFDNQTDAPGAMGVWRGRDGFLAMLEKVTEAFSEYSLEHLETSERGDQVTLALREFGRGRTSGLPIERQIYLTYTLREGTVVRMLATLEPPEGVS
jgi:ketosteroid isomerase-like protein